MGLLSKAPDGAKDGDDLTETLGFRRYEDVVGEATQYKGASRSDGLEVPAPKLASMPGVYDIEGFRKYGRTTFGDDELVVVTEKIHGQNARFVHDGERLHVGSRTRWLSTDPETNTWAKVARRYDLAGKLAAYPGLIFFGETYGNNSDMPYGVERSKTGDALAIFDVFDSCKGCWLDAWTCAEVCAVVDLAMVPVLARGRFGDIVESLPTLAEGPSTLAGHVREGWVIKSAVERWDSRLGRVILKCAGEGYLTRKTA